MILTCPNCSSRFNVDAALLGEEGRTVKCTTCDEKWFQEPLLEEEASVESEALAESVEEEPKEEPIEETEVVPEVEVTPPQDDVVETVKTPKEKKPEKEKMTKGAKLAIAASVLVFILTLTYLLMNSAPIMRKNPSMQAFYGWFGVKMKVPGAGLIFDRVTAQENGTLLKLMGNITNLESVEKDIPLIEATLLDSHGAVIEKWMITPDETTIKAENTHSFQDTRPLPHGVHLDHANINVRFVLSTGDSVAAVMEHDDQDGDGHNGEEAHDDASHHDSSHKDDGHHESKHHDTGHSDAKQHH